MQAIRILEAISWPWSEDLLGLQSQKPAIFRGFRAAARSPCEALREATRKFVRAEKISRGLANFSARHNPHIQIFMIAGTSRVRKNLRHTID